MNYLKNFGTEISETFISENFNDLVIFYAAAEESSDKLINDSGDAFLL